MTAEQKLEKYLKEIALKAVLKHPKAKLYAKVNHMDNFSLVMWGVAENEICGEIIDDVVEFNREERAWFNKMHDTPSDYHSKMRKFCIEIANEAYTLLRA